MTNPTKLEACPFCDGATKRVPNAEPPMVWHQGQPHCPVASYAITEEQWQFRRPTPTIDSDAVERARRSIVSYLFQECQPDRGDVFSWCDDHAEEIARTALASLPGQERIAGRGADISGIWQQARENHERYSAMGDLESDLRFLTLGLVGEAGELANFVKKRWRDGDLHEDDCRKEVADVLAYTMMVAQRLGMTPADLIATVAKKQAVFVAKMETRNLKDSR